MKGMGREKNRRHFLIGDFAARGIFAVIEATSNRQPFAVVVAAMR